MNLAIHVPSIDRYYDLTLIELPVPVQLSLARESNKLSCDSFIYGTTSNKANTVFELFQTLSVARMEENRNQTGPTKTYILRF